MEYRWVQLMGLLHVYMAEPNIITVHQMPGLFIGSTVIIFREEVIFTVITANAKLEPRENIYF